MLSRDEQHAKTTPDVRRMFANLRFTISACFDENARSGKGDFRLSASNEAMGSEDGMLTQPALETRG